MSRDHTEQTRAGIRAAANDCWQKDFGDAREELKTLVEREVASGRLQVRSAGDAELLSRSVLLAYLGETIKLWSQEASVLVGATRLTQVLARTVMRVEGAEAEVTRLEQDLPALWLKLKGEVWLKLSARIADDGTIRLAYPAPDAHGLRSALTQVERVVVFCWRETETGIEAELRYCSGAELLEHALPALNEDELEGCISFSLPREPLTLAGEIGFQARLDYPASDTYEEISSTRGRIGR